MRLTDSINFLREAGCVTMALSEISPNEDMVADLAQIVLEKIYEAKEILGGAENINGATALHPKEDLSALVN